MRYAFVFALTCALVVTPALADPPSVAPPPPIVTPPVAPLVFDDRNAAFTFDVPVHVKLEKIGGSFASYRVKCGVSTAEATVVDFANVSSEGAASTFYDGFSALGERGSGIRGKVLATGAKGLPIDSNGAFDGVVHVVTTPSGILQPYDASRGHSYACFLARVSDGKALENVEHYGTVGAPYDTTTFAATTSGAIP